MRVPVLTGALVGLVASGLSLVPLTTSAEASAPAAAPAVTTPVPTPPPISWGACQDKSLKADKAECGMLTVPLDYADPSAGTIKLAVARVLHTKKNFKGAVFTNPGGPGGSGLQLARYGQFVPKGAGLNYDWYGVDPRGVGDSEPALSCDTGYFGFDRQPYEPKTNAITSYWLTKTADYAAACASSPAKALLPHLTTADNVKDFESLRVAIAQPQVTWYGFSYGTYIGQMYASMYPGSLKAMILDGVVDASRAWYPANIDQDYAFQKTFKAFFAWLGKYDSVYHLGKNGKQVKKTVDKLKKRLARKPALGGKIGPAELDDAILQAGYYNLTWLDVAKPLAALANKGDGKGIKRLYRSSNPTGEGADNSYAMYLATECTDAPWPTDFAKWQSDMNAVAQAAPIFTWSNAWFNMPCRTWGVPSPAAAPVVTGAFTGPVLLTNEQYDAATPYSGALATRALFPNSALVEGKKGTSHAISLYGVSCIDDSITTLLKKGTLPTRKAGNRADLACKGLQPPDPTVSASDVSARRSLVDRALPAIH